MFTVSDAKSAISELASIGYVKPQNPASPWARPNAKLSLHTPCEAEGLKVHLTDTGTIGCGAVEMRVSLSHLYGLALATPLQCELGGSLASSALALTKFGEETFDLDQTALMGLELKQSNASVGVSAPTAAGEFSVSALCVGALNLSLSAKPTGPPSTAAVCGGSDDEDSEIPALAAAAVEVQVYLPLVCLPKALSLVPQASGAISCSLGPSGVVTKTYVVATSTADDIITVDRHGVVRPSRNLPLLVMSRPVLTDCFWCPGRCRGRSGDCSQRRG